MSTLSALPVSVLRQQLAQLTPEQRRALGLSRPASDTEAAAYDQAQQPAGAPADFAGAVFPNPDGARVSDDTESGIDPLRLPHGVTLQHPNFNGQAPGDVSNPPQAQIVGPHMQTVASQSSPLTPDQFMAQQGAPAETLTPDQFMEHATGPKKAEPGFWSALKGDLKAMVTPHPGALGDEPLPGRVAASVKSTEANKREFAEADAARKAAGYSLPYRAAAPVAEALGVNVPGMEEAAREGDTGGVLGHAAALPAVMVATEGLARGVPKAAKASAPAVRTAARITNKVLEKAPATVGGAAGAAAGGYFGGHLGAEFGGAAGALAGKELLPNVHVPGEGFGLPKRVEGGPATIPPEAPASAAAISAPEVATTAPSGAGIPRTLSGDSALRQILTGQDNANLLKIAKSRGIDVAQESQLKPGVADNKLINKIIDDHSPDELQNVRDTYLEANRFKHQFGDIGPEAWKTLSLKTYFPDLKLPQAVLRRTQSAIELAGKPPAEAMNAPASAAAETKAPVAETKAPLSAAKARIGETSADLTDLLKKSVEQAKGAKVNAPPRFVYRARDVGEEGVPLQPHSHGQATSEPLQAVQYAEPGQRGTEQGQVVRIDLSKLKPSDYVIETHPDGMKWVRFTRPLTESEVSHFAGAGQPAGKLK